MERVMFLPRQRPGADYLRLLATADALSRAETASEDARRGAPSSMEVVLDGEGRCRSTRNATGAAPPLPLWRLAHVRGLGFDAAYLPYQLLEAASSDSNAHAVLLLRVGESSCRRRRASARAR